MSIFQGFKFEEAVPRRLVSHIMSANPLCVPSSFTLGQATAEMEAQKVSSLLVAEAMTPIAILTERDVIRAIEQGLDSDTVVASIMTSGLITIRADEEVHAAYHRMVQHGIRHLVVIDGSDNIIGILSETDFRKHLRLESFLGIVSVSKVMSQQFLAMSGESTMLDAARAMQYQRVSCVIVTEDKSPRGIVTERDMVRLFSHQAVSTPLTEIMTSPVISVSMDMPLVDAVRQMLASNIRHLAVVDRAGRMAGVLNEKDTVRQLEDEYIQMLQELVLKQAKDLNEDKFRALINQFPHSIIVKDLNLTYLSCNESFAAEFGVKAQDVFGKTDFDFVSKELAEQFRAEDRKVIEEGGSLSFDQYYVNNGNSRWIHTTKSPMRDADGKIIGLVVVFYDVTEKKRAADELARNAWTMTVINNANRALLFAKNESQLLQDICTAITYQDRYPLAWIGWADQNPQHSITVTASAGNATAYLKDSKISWADDEYGNGPTGRSIRYARIEVNSDTHDNLQFKPWLNQAEKYHIRSSASIPFRINGRVAGALVVYAGEVDAFNSAEVQLFDALADNIGYGLSSLRMRNAYEAEMQEKADLAIKLDAALVSALMAIATTLEQRDPYTAGHQRSVGDLALKIAQELALTESQKKALHLSAIVHDIGKIQVPAEILTKPGRLNAVEFSLIKLHPESGYEILRQIDFPWPIAEIIRQHHEYLDGSGYPRGLKGDEILPLARILTVADIVESMSSDRPYRAALGVNQAVDAIIEMRGTKLDPLVVDACVRVVQRGEFQPSSFHP